MLPVWIPLAFLQTSGDFSWNFALLVCRTIVHGHGILCHVTTGEHVDMQTVPESGEYIYMPSGMPACYRLQNVGGTEVKICDASAACGFTGWALGPDGSSRATAPEENEGWHGGSSVTTQSHVWLSRISTYARLANLLSTLHSFACRSGSVKMSWPETEAA